MDDKQENILNIISLTFFISCSDSPCGSTSENLQYKEKVRVKQACMANLDNTIYSEWPQFVAPGDPGDGQHLLRVLRGQQTVHQAPGGGGQCPPECY